jgi:hypothetical protein
MADDNSKNENGNEQGHGSQRTNTNDVEWTSIRTPQKEANGNTTMMNKHENRTTDCKHNGKEHIEETGKDKQEKGRNNTAADGVTHS